MICRLPLLTVVTELRTPTRWQDGAEPVTAQAMRCGRRLDRRQRQKCTTLPTVQEHKLGSPMGP